MTERMWMPADDIDKVLEIIWGLSPAVDEDVGAHIALHDPASVLADINAKRKVIAEYRVLMDSFESQPDEESALISEGERNALEGVIRTLAGTAKDADE